MGPLQHCTFYVFECRCTQCNLSITWSFLEVLMDIFFNLFFFWSLDWVPDVLFLLGCPEPRYDTYTTSRPHLSLLGGKMMDNDFLLVNDLFFPQNYFFCFESGIANLFLTIHGRYPYSKSFPTRPTRIWFPLTSSTPSLSLFIPSMCSILSGSCDTPIFVRMAILNTDTSPSIIMFSSITITVVSLYRIFH